MNKLATKGRAARARISTRVGRQRLGNSKREKHQHDWIQTRQRGRRHTFACSSCPAHMRKKQAHIPVGTPPSLFTEETGRAAGNVAQGEFETKREQYTGEMNGDVLQSIRDLDFDTVMKTYTKERLLAVAMQYRIRVRKSWTKSEIVKAIMPYEPNLGEWHRRPHGSPGRRSGPRAQRTTHGGTSSPR